VIIKLLLVASTCNSSISITTLGLVKGLQYPCRFTVLSVALVKISFYRAQSGTLHRYKQYTRVLLCENVSVGSYILTSSLPPVADDTSWCFMANWSCTTN
jgi:hypothetical protein